MIFILQCNLSMISQGTSIMFHVLDHAMKWYLAIVKHQKVVNIEWKLWAPRTNQQKELETFLLALFRSDVRGWFDPRTAPSLLVHLVGSPVAQKGHQDSVYQNIGRSVFGSAFLCHHIHLRNGHIGGQKAIRMLEGVFVEVPNNLLGKLIAFAHLRRRL